VLASTANLIRAAGWQRGQPYDMGTRNFEVLREWNNAEIYRRAIVYLAQQLR
jgi:membrane-bound lytic murein transglycosylase B